MTTHAWKGWNGWFCGIALLHASAAPAAAFRTTPSLEATAQVRSEKNAKDATSSLALRDLVARVKTQNYAVRQEAERVFQARQRVRGAIGDLLPHLRPFGVVGAVLEGPSGLLGLVGDLVPFIFPSNWFQMRATQRLLNAEKKSFSSLRANEVFDTESLYQAISRDARLAELLDAQLDWLTEVTERLRMEELAGTLASGSADYFRLNFLRLKEERSNLEELLVAERAALLHAVALDPLDTRIVLEPAPLVNPSSFPTAETLTYAYPSRERSYELQALDWLIEAAGFMRGSASFGFLDPNSDQALGFGMAAPVRIAKSERRNLITLKSSTASQLAQKVIETVTLHNQSIERHRDATEGATAVRAEMLRLIQRHDSGDEELDSRAFVDELARLQEESLMYEAKRASEEARFSIARARLDRLMLNGNYAGMETP